MSDDLYKLFKEEADEYIKGLNDGLLKLELSEGDDKKNLVKEMNRMAHSMKGAARAVGFGLIETVSHYMEEIFYASMNSGLKLSPEMGDSLYDGLDLIQRDMDGDEQDEEVIAEVLNNLEAIVTTFRLPDATIEDEHISNQATESKASFMEDASEIRALSEDSTEMPALTDEEVQPEPVFETQNLAQAPPSDVSEELLQIFYVEVIEHLAGLNDGLLRVETASVADKPELLREMNRVAHSMKGAARAVGFGLIESISHYMEEVLQAALEGKLQLTPQAVDALYDGLDLIQNALDGNPNEKSVIKAVLVSLDRLISKPATSEMAVTASKSDMPKPSELDTSTLEIPAALMTSTVESGGTPTMLLRPPEETLRVSVEKLDQLMADSSELLMARMQGEARHHLLQGVRRQHMRWLREWRSVRAAYIRLARRVQEQEQGGSSELTTLFRFLETNQRYLAQANRDLAQLSQMLAQDNMNMATLADQMQDNVSDLRMMPFETIVSGFQRMVRDMARDLNKQIHLEITGAGVEIDKTVLDALKDPLLHLMRNAIDHGLESPQERKHLGKMPTGHLRLDVEQRGSEIVIRVEDDGHGLDVEKIRRKAIERGLLATQEALALTDDDARMLVFHSGFSTSETVTSLSGRGLGMDIVRNRVEGLRGRVSVMSAPGEGTVVTINVPVSLTRLRVITLRIGEEEYAIPSIMVERMETIQSDIIYTAEGEEMLNVNGRPTPLVSMATTLNVPTSNERGDEVNVVTLHTVDRSVAFEVDHLYSEFELVLKPLGRELEAASFVAGAALLGNGDVIIVLDANDLVRSATGTSFPISDRLLVPTPQTVARKRVRVLVVDDSITTRTLEKNILEAVGFEVFVAMDGAEAWTRIPELEPDLVVSDVEMPQMNGLELARRIKSTERTKHLPVILLTSLGKPEQREAGLKAGADAYLVKSRFDQGELLDTINSVLY